MNEKTKVIVFEKKEVALLFLCVLAIAFISFTLGIRIGKNFQLTNAGITDVDRHTVELKSVDEELVEKVIHEQQQERAPSTSLEKTTYKSKASKIEQNYSPPTPDSAHDLHYKKLEDEFNHIDQEINTSSTAIPPLTPHTRGAAGRQKSEEKAEEQVTMKAHTSPGNHHQEAEKKEDKLGKEGKVEREAKETKVENEEKIENKENYTGKFTIQLGSYQAESDAIKFADGFKVRGYSPIIQEVKIVGKGDWYRVSLGAFSGVSDAKDYILKEESLFQGQDYVITEFQ